MQSGRRSNSDLIYRIAADWVSALAARVGGLAPPPPI